MPSIIEIAATAPDEVDSYIQAYTAAGGEIVDRIAVGEGFQLETGVKAKRIPVRLSEPMGGAKVSIDNGTIGRGRGVESLYYQAAHIPFQYLFELSYEEAKSNYANVMDANQLVFGRAASTVPIWKDIFFHQDGSGVVAGAAGGSVASTVSVDGVNRTKYVFADVSDFVDVRNLVQGMAVEVFASDLTARRSPSSGSNVTFIRSINVDEKSVILNQEIASATNGDILVIPGLIDPAGVFASGYSGGATPPLSSFNSTWPAARTVANKGFTGDAFRHGYLYPQNTDPTKYFSGLQKSALPELIPVATDASGSPLNHTMIVQLINKLIKKRPSVSHSDWTGIISLEQKDAAWRAGQAVITTMTQVAGEYGKIRDAAPSDMGLSDTITLGGVVCHADRRQLANRVDFLVTKNIGVCKAGDLRRVTEFGTNGFVDVMDTTSGTPKYTFLMAMLDDYDFAYRDPGANALIQNLSVPAGY
jgi:hypothetical protein